MPPNKKPISTFSDRDFVIEPRYYFYGWSRSPQVKGQTRLIRSLKRVTRSLPAGHRFKIWDSKRPRSVQLSMIESFKKRIKLLYPHATPKEQTRIVRSFAAAPLKRVLRPDTHRHGGAVDLTIVDARDHELYMGTDHDDLTDRAATNYYETRTKLSSLDREAKKNRSLLVHVLTKAGLRNYHREWWHWYVPLSKKRGFEVDAILVLALTPPTLRRIRKRIALATRLYTQGVSNAIILSGRTWGGLRTMPRISEAKIMARLAQKFGMPSKNIFLEELSLETTGSFYFTKKQILEPHGFKKLLIITHSAHMPKVKFLAKKVLGPAYILRFMSSEKDIGHLRGHSTHTDIKKFFAHVQNGDDQTIARMIQKHPYYRKRNYTDI